MGGFSQFVYNCPNVTVFNLVGEGLEAIEAYKHLELFAAFNKLLSGLTEQELRDFLSNDYFGENPTRDRLDVHNDVFYDLNNKSESLIEMNAHYLRRHPRLEVVPEADLEDRLDAIAAQITDLEERKAAAEANEKGFYFTLEGEEL
ncbi:DMP19 family protein [Capnocytophaga haemolytica]